MDKENAISKIGLIPEYKIEVFEHEDLYGNSFRSFHHSGYIPGTIGRMVHIWRNHRNFAPDFFAAKINISTKQLHQFETATPFGFYPNTAQMQSIGDTLKIAADDFHYLILSDWKQFWLEKQKEAIPYLQTKLQGLDILEIREPIAERNWSALFHFAKNLQLLTGQIISLFLCDPAGAQNQLPQGDWIPRQLR